MSDFVDEHNQYLTFVLREETFAAPVTRVREILEYTPLTRIPRMPAAMAGVINLRGRVVPVIDLRIKLGMERVEPTRHTCIVVLEIPGDGKVVEVGALVDAVQEVLVFNAEQIEPPPRLGVGIEGQYITGMGKKGDRFVILLDVTQLMSSSEIIPFHEQQLAEATA